MQGVIVLAVSVYTRRDGQQAAKVTVASTPRSPNVRGFVSVDFDALPEVAQSIKALPGVYKLDLDLLGATGFGGRANELRPLVTGATLIAAMVPERREVKSNA